MMGPRGLLLIGALFAVLAVALVVTPPAQGSRPPLSVYSAQDHGGKALWLWLDELGYDVSTLETRVLRPPEGGGTILILAPSQPLRRSEVDELERWVRAGGRLVVAVDDRNASLLLARFDLGLRTLSSSIDTARPLDNTLVDPRAGEILVQTASSLTIRASSAQPFLGDGEHVLGARLPAGSGELLVLTAPGALSNLALRREGNARLALSLVGSRDRGPVRFDELHHGYVTERAGSLLDLALDRAWGQASLFAAAIVLMYLALRGRRFGRAIPLVTSRGRSLSEYVSSMAALYRAGGKRAFVAEHFGRRLRRDIASALGLPADAPDARIEAAIRAIGRDPAPALDLLRLCGRAPAIAESELLRLVRAGDRITRELARSSPS